MPLCWTRTACSVITSPTNRAKGGKPASASNAQA
jgi:hypothetical protein